jgi:hypothetical protein
MREPTPYDALLDAWRGYAELSLAMSTAYARLWTTALAPAGDVHINFPFGQGFTMNIAPATSWDVGWTKDRALERDIIDNAGSYGLQIGRMMDVVALMANGLPVKGAPLDDLMHVKNDVDAIKQKHGYGVVEIRD